MNQAEQTYQYVKSLKKKYVTGFKYSENPNDVPKLETKKTEVQEKLDHLQKRKAKLDDLEKRIEDIVAIPDDMNRQINSDAKWLELASETIETTENFIKTMHD